VRTQDEDDEGAQGSLKVEAQEQEMGIPNYREQQKYRLHLCLETLEGRRPYAQ